MNGYFQSIPWVNTNHGAHFHQWVGIQIGAAEMIIDPWPSGGTGNLNDASATTGWDNVK